MTPALPDILIGQAVALATPLPPEAGGDYFAGRVGILAMLASLAAQEAERGPSARVWENEAIRTLLRDATAYADVLGANENGAAVDLSWRALDETNARLRRCLIALHEAAETRGDRALQGRILGLYVEMAAARRLQLGG